MEVAEDMGAGWNLGNGLDAYDSTGGNEYAWGNPTITQNLINSVKQSGFKTIRVGVSYMNHIGSAPDYQIDTDWLNRVNEARGVQRVEILWASFVLQFLEKNMFRRCV